MLETQTLHRLLGPASLALMCVAAAGVSYITMQQPMLGIGAMYALLFGLFAWVRPELALTLTLAAAPFQNDLSTGGPVRFSLAEVHLAILCPVFFLRQFITRRPIHFGPLAIALLLHLGVSVFASMNQWRDTSLVSLIQMGIYCVIAVMLFASMVDSPGQLLLPLYGLIAVCTFLAIVAVTSGSNYILGLHKNGLGASLACAVVIGCELLLSSRSNAARIAMALGVLTCSAGLILSLSRGAWLAAALGIVVILVMRRRFKLFFGLILLVAPVVMVCWSYLPEESRDYAASFDSKRRNISLRLESIKFASEQWKSSPVIGVGVGLRKEYDATNLFWLTMAETGIVGVCTFALLHATVVGMGSRAARRIGPGNQAYSLCVIAIALLLGRLLHGMVDHYWSRGAILMCWSSVGMMVAAWAAARNGSLKENEEDEGRIIISRLQSPRRRGARDARVRALPEPTRT